jgi:hypothetical protein
LGERLVNQWASAVLSKNVDPIQAKPIMTKIRIIMTIPTSSALPLGELRRVGSTSENEYYAVAVPIRCAEQPTSGAG